MAQSDVLAREHLRLTQAPQVSRLQREATTHGLRHVGILLVACAAMMFASASAFAIQPVSPNDQPLPLSSARHSAASMPAWKDRKFGKFGKFGMFIHFGLFSVPGGTWKGRWVDNGYSEQIGTNGNIPMAEYAALAKTLAETRLSMPASP